MQVMIRLLLLRTNSACIQVLCCPQVARCTQKVPERVNDVRERGAFSVSVVSLPTADECAISLDGELL